MEKEELLDINGKRRIWERLKEIEFKQSLIEDLSKHNSELAISQLTDLGWNCTITYRQTSRGETSSCKCRVVK